MKPREVSSVLWACATLDYPLESGTADALLLQLGRCLDLNPHRTYHEQNPNSHLHSGDASGASQHQGSMLGERTRVQLWSADSLGSGRLGSQPGQQDQQPGPRGEEHGSAEQGGFGQQKHSSDRLLMKPQLYGWSTTPPPLPQQEPQQQPLQPPQQQQSLQPSQQTQRRLPQASQHQDAHMHDAASQHQVESPFLERLSPQLQPDANLSNHRYKQQQEQIEVVMSNGGSMETTNGLEQPNEIDISQVSLCDQLYLTRSVTGFNL